MSEDFDAIVKKVYSKPVNNYELIEGDVQCNECGGVILDHSGYDSCPSCGGHLVTITSQAKRDEVLTWAVDESGFRHPFVEDRPDSHAKFVQYDQENLD